MNHENTDEFEQEWLNRLKKKTPARRGRSLMPRRRLLSDRKIDKILEGYDFEELHRRILKAIGTQAGR